MADGTGDEKRSRDTDINNNNSNSNVNSNNVNNDTKPTTNASFSPPSNPTLLSRLASLLPPSVLPALKNKRTIKTFVRCLLVTLSGLICIVDQNTLERLGQAAFFVAILSMMLPPNMAVALFLFAALTLVLGMLLGWAWGAAAMAASIAARSQVLLASQYETIEANLLPGINPDAQFEASIFTGAFLDPRSSVVFGIFFFFGTFGLALIRAYVPRLALMAIFGTIVLDVMCSYGPLFPSAQYTLATMFLIPTGVYLGIAVGGIILIFPETMNHVWLTSLTTGVLTPALSMLELHTRALSLPASPSPDDWRALRAEGHALAKQLTTAARGLKGQTGMLELEASRGRLGPGDLKKVGGGVDEMVGRTLGLLSLIEIVVDIQTTDTSSSPPTRPSDPASGTVTPRYARLRQTVREREQRHGHDLDALRPVLEEASRELRTACEEGLRGAKAWLEEVNSTRWRLRAPSEKEDLAHLDEARAQLARIRTALAHWRTTHRLTLVRPFERFFDPATGALLPEITARPQSGSKEHLFAAQSLFVCFVVGTGWKAYAESLTGWLEGVLELRGARVRNKVWMPMGLWKIGMKVAGSTAGMGFDDGVAMGVGKESERAVEEDADTVEDDDSEKGEDAELEEVPKPTVLDPDATPSQHTYLGTFQARVAAFLKWWGTPQALFALRYAIVSMALWAVAVIPRSAYFNYINRGLWALIMSQTGMGIYAGEQIANFVIRISATAIGLVLGMVAWYIGAGGLGSGNPYGVVIITTALVSPFLFVRIAAPQEQMAFWLMTGVMLIFVVGYSWVDGHITVLSDPGVGVSVAWRRAVTVIVGFAAAFVVMVFPSMTSARQVVRKTLARTTEELSEVFAGEADACVREAHASGGGGKEWAKRRDKRLKRLGRKVLAVAESIHAMGPSMVTAKFEPTFKGPWPVGTYERLRGAQYSFIHYVALLNGALHELDAEWLQVLVHKTPFLNPNLLSDIGSTIYIVARALRHAYPVPSSLTPIKERLIYHERHSAAYGGAFADDPVALEEEIGANPDRVDGATIGLRTLTLDVLKDEQLVFHSTAVMALSGIIRTVDDITDIARELCGTTATFGGLDIMRTEYLGMEEAAIRRRAGRTD